MNKQESDILKVLYKEPFINQRILSEISGHSLGIVNKSIKSLINQKYLNENIDLTLKAREEFKYKTPKRAIILAAGFGMRMVPINLETPKAFLKINGEYLIERQINQLHEIGIKEIYIIVGFMKEKFEYLIDKYNVELIVNPEYSLKNNLHSIKLILNKISNAYIIPCDIWCDKNPFSKEELYSWYMVNDLVDDDSEVRVNRKMELIKSSKQKGGNSMIGISYLLEEDAIKVRNKIKELILDSKYNNSFWEEALYEKEKMTVLAKLCHSTDVIEINTYEQLRELDNDSEQLKSNAIDIIKKSLNVSSEEIVDITVLKKGMTNRSFLFSCKDQKYIMRIPGEGTDQLINRKEEADVYNIIKDKNICDDIEYINPKNGYKITKYISNTRTCNPKNIQDLKKCMKFLKIFHQLELKVNHEFDLFKQLEFYESLWNGIPSAYIDYIETKKKIFLLKKYINKNIDKKVLTHIDAVPDNFLFSESEDGKQDIRLIDWEYAGMQDPHVDIAMFCIYSLYNKKEIDRLINIYFENKCPKNIKIKIYCYIAVCGLLWSNWCEYKRNLGVEFGEYSLKQYRYAKDYYKYAIKEMEEIENEL